MQLSERRGPEKRVLCRPVKSQQFTFGDAKQKLEPEDTGIALKGLPAVGFAAYKVNNGAMSYGNAAEHKTDSVLSSSAVPL